MKNLLLFPLKRCNEVNLHDAGAKIMCKVSQTLYARIPVHSLRKTALGHARYLLFEISGFPAQH